MAPAHRGRGAGKDWGAAAAGYRHGELVADIWSGRRDLRTGDPWTRHSMALSFSTIKGGRGKALPMLVDRGLIGFSTGSPSTWPELARNGKSEMRVRHLLTHEAGLHDIPTSSVMPARRSSGI